MPNSGLTYYRQSSHPDTDPMQVPPDVDWDAFPQYVPTAGEMEEQYQAHLAEQQRLASPEVTEEE